MGKLKGKNMFMKKQYHPSPKTIRKISKKIKEAWRLGVFPRKLSEEIKRKISSSHIGKKWTREQHKKFKTILAGNKRALGHRLSPLTKKRIRDAHKGKHHSPETEFKKGMTISRATRERMAVAQRKRYDRIGRKTASNLILRTSAAFLVWRLSVFTRDNWTCQKCHSRGGRLHAHHIQNFAQFPELRFEINNGITFCAPCHRTFHKTYGVKNNNYQQTSKFICQK